MNTALDLCENQNIKSKLLDLVFNQNFNIEPIYHINGPPTFFNSGPRKTVISAGYDTHEEEWIGYNLSAEVLSILQRGWKLIPAKQEDNLEFYDFYITNPSSIFKTVKNEKIILSFINIHHSYHYNIKIKF